MTAEPSNRGDWFGKIVLLYVRDAGPTTQPGVALESPRIELRHGEEFLVGRVPHQERDWASGLEAGVRWSQVVHFLVFGSRDEYERVVSNAPPSWELRGDRSPS
jgi:hypothetical protein